MAVVRHHHSSISQTHEMCHLWQNQWKVEEYSWDQLDWIDVSSTQSMDISIPELCPTYHVANAQKSTNVRRQSSDNESQWEFIAT